MSSAHPELDFKPEMPRRMDHGIGIVGAGGVVNYAHLPAYAQAGFKVVGITDKDRAARREDRRRPQDPQSLHVRSRNWWPTRKSRLWTLPYTPGRR